MYIIYSSFEAMIQKIGRIFYREEYTILAVKLYLEWGKVLFVNCLFKQYFVSIVKENEDKIPMLNYVYIDILILLC